MVLVDLQERLLPAMSEPECLIQRVVCLAKGAAILGIPIFATEQYRKGLGPTVEAVAQVMPGVAPFQKLHFSACGAAGFLDALRQKNVEQVILCGIEAHVCVTQTCLDLLGEGLGVFVVVDAVDSRTAGNRKIGLERMRDSGAVIVSTEMVLFELLKEAGTDEFKQILPLVK